ncbi:helix-turn-helix transcriptional regulator [Bradyrhizobium lablabi]|uniref:helix-turn-helix transcriptional regulator n=1 Tax=Bradyrhizobium lablabi TaxID=722472 RepID=UPI001BA67467|nr:helix-turn-helix transcriptional regulator [Bradyrhizobium lablabi]
MIISDKRSETILNLVYDAAAEEELWSSVLTEIADLTRSQGGILFGQSLTASRVYFDYNGRLDEECNRVYQERHMQNVWSEHMEHQPVGRVVFSDDAVEMSALRATAFFDEVLRPQDVAHNSMIALAAKEDFRAAFNICRSSRQGAFGADEQKLFEWLVPHLRRSITLGFKLDSYQAMQRAAFEVLEQLSDAVMLLDRRARLLFANAAARALEESGALRLRQCVTTYSQPHSQRLAGLIRSALEGSAGGSMSMPGCIAGQHLTILVSSVRSKDMGRFSDLNMKDAAVLVFIIDPANHNSIPLARIMDAFGLTQAEARVALASSSGKTMFETAQLLGLSPNTIKTHLRRVFAKTATGRQAELARLMASIGTMRFPNDDR